MEKNMIKSALNIKLDIYQLIDKYTLEAKTMLEHEEMPLRVVGLEDRLKILSQLKDDILNLSFSLPLERRKSYADRVRDRKIQRRPDTDDLQGQ